MPGKYLKISINGQSRWWFSLFGFFDIFREISHSAVSDMQTIEQQTPSGREPSRYDNSYRERQSSRNRDFFDDEFEMIGGFSSGPPRWSSLLPECCLLFYSVSLHGIPTLKCQVIMILVVYFHGDCISEILLKWFISRWFLQKINQL